MEIERYKNQDVNAVIEISNDVIAELENDGYIVDIFNTPVAIDTLQITEKGSKALNVIRQIV